jgi:hypothetical protein
MSLNTEEFERLMQTVADGWNEGNARKAGDCFSEDAIYVEPPDKQLYHGRAEIFAFFGGDTGPGLPMRMTWHHLAFNQEEQVGFGEYTFQLNNRYHGIVIVKLESGLIKQWREYQYRSELDWEAFTSHNHF